MSSFRDPVVCLSAVGFGFGGESLAGKDTPDEVPDRAIAAALNRMRGFVRARTCEFRVRQMAVEALDGSDNRIAKR
ncbi:MAG TPA: hypothetical protein VGL17_01445 [Gemmatimonadaceae bacterium]